MRMTMIHVPLSRIHFKLHLKSFIYRVASEEIRGCNVRELFGVPISLPFEQGARGVAEELSGHVRRHRREPAELSDAHTRVVHGLTGYGGAEARLLLRIAQELVEVLKGFEARLQLLRIWREVSSKAAEAAADLYQCAEVHLIGGAQRAC